MRPLNRSVVNHINQGTVVNQICYSKHEKSLDITSTVPLFRINLSSVQSQKVFFYFLLFCKEKLNEQLNEVILIVVFKCLHFVCYLVIKLMNFLSKDIFKYF